MGCGGSQAASEGEDTMTTTTTTTTTSSGGDTTQQQKRAPAEKYEPTAEDAEEANPTPDSPTNAIPWSEKSIIASGSMLNFR